MERVYCQQCGKELTEEGAFVSSSGRSYCIDKNPASSRFSCIDISYLAGDEKDTFGKIYPSRNELSGAVSNWELIIFDKLRKD